LTQAAWAHHQRICKGKPNNSFAAALLETSKRCSNNV
jgi:hypothetical protein